MNTTHLDYAITSYRPNGTHSILFTTQTNADLVANTEGDNTTGTAFELHDGNWHYNYRDITGTYHAAIFPSADALTDFTFIDPTRSSN